jgi:hypothetical protein
MGMGTAICAEFVKVYKQNSKDAYGVFMSWAQGFLSGWNIGALARKESTRNISSKSVQQQERHIRSYCDDHPLNDLMEAALDLYLSSRKLACRELAPDEITCHNRRRPDSRIVTFKDCGSVGGALALLVATIPPHRNMGPSAWT